LNGETSATLSLANVQKVQAGDYFVVVSDSRGAVTSAVAVLTVYEMDFGDAPDTLGYPTTLAFNGARHRLLPGIYLGNRADFEAEGLSNSGASGDDSNNTDDEDGISFVGPLLLALLAAASVAASTNGFIDAWIDFNRNGTWTDPGEQILTSRAVMPGTNLLSFQIPGVAVSVTTFARFRFSTTGGLGYEGFAADGEVEDYPVAVRPAVDLVLTQAESADPVTVTSNFAYMVTLTNRGPSTATSVSLTNVLPPNLTFLSATPSQGGCSILAGRLTCNFGTLLRNAGVAVTLNFRADGPGTVINTISAGGVEADVNVADNIATQITSIVTPTMTLTNLAAIAVSDGTETGPGTGNPYPSTLTIAGMTTAVHSVTVTLSNLTHSFPSDLDILLVGPQGQSALVMSDAGAGFGLTNITFTLDDAATRLCRT
jgi:uncharacterized repeat protein (TIGR01451 family)